MSANGVCINNIIQKLPVNDYNVTCLCYDDYETTSDDLVRIIRISRGPFKSFLYRNETNNNRVIKVLCKIVSFLEKAINILFIASWPWNDPIYTGKVFKRTKQLHKETAFDYIIAVHTPISSLIVAHRMKKKYPNIKYIPYFLDSLSGGRPYSLISKKCNLIKKLQWEKHLLSNADKIIVMESSRKHHEQYSCETSYYNKFIYLDVPLLNIHEEIKYDNPFPDDDEIRVLYSGVAIQPMRNMSFVANLAKKVHEIDSRIVFYVIGQCNCENLFDPTYIRYLKSIPHEQLLPYLEYSDVLINFGVRVPSAISGKIFEYMSFGKPIISTFSIPNEACITYLYRYPLSLLLEENKDNIDKTAHDTVDFIIRNLGKKVNLFDIKKTFKNNLPETFIEEVFEKF